jgi:polysaccharide biosynthesis protein PslH
MLFLAPVVPAGGGNGLAMRVGMFLEAYASMADIDCIVVRLAGGPTDVAFCRRFALRADIIEVTGRAETPFALLSAIAAPSARLAAFRQYGRPSLCGNLSAAVREEVRACMGSAGYDLVHVSRAYLTPLLDLVAAASPRARILVDLDEDESSTRGSLARLHRIGGDALAAEWEEIEALAYARLAAAAHGIDLLVASSALEVVRTARHWRAAPIAVVPNAVTVPTPHRASDLPHMTFVGTLGYFPNRDAVVWTLHDIWPRIRLRCPQATLRLVGRNASPRLRRIARQPGVSLLDGVADVGKVYRSSALAIAPVRAGGGTRIKIVEAGAHALPCVSTTVGAEGLGASQATGPALADRAEAFAEACVERLRSPALRRSEGQRLRRFVQRYHDRRVVMAQLVRLVSALC